MAVSPSKGNYPANPRMYITQPDELVNWLMSRSPGRDLSRIEFSKTDQKAIQYSLTGLQKIDLSFLSKSIRTPCLLVYGQNDPSLEALPSSDQYESLPENTHQITFEQSGHFPMLDEPSKFNRLLSDFLNLNSGVSTRQLQLKEEWKRRVR